jgi:hypothetical protein
VKSDAQHRLTRWRIAAAPTTSRYVSCGPANDVVGRSSAVALERTAYAALTPSRATSAAIASATSSGMTIASIVARISALSVRITSRSSGCRRAGRSSCTSSVGACATICAKASVDTQKPAGT